MKIRKAGLSDLDEIIEIYKNVIITMEKNNIHQWDEIYPNSSILKEDILNDEMYVGVVDSIIVSAVVLNSEFDEEYKNGRCQYNNKNFGIVHRLCVNPLYQNKKIGNKTMLMIEELLRNKGVESIRLDAFSENPYALKMYKKLGYKKVGEVTWRKGLFYLFQKKI